MVRGMDKALYGGCFLKIGCPGCRPVPGIFRKQPPYKALSMPLTDTLSSNYSHLNINGLPASQSAAAGPLGIFAKKLMMFGQSEKRNGKQRAETELANELLHGFKDAEKVEYVHIGRPPALKLPLTAAVTFETEQAALQNE